MNYNYIKDFGETQFPLRGKIYVEDVRVNGKSVVNNNGVALINGVGTVPSSMEKLDDYLYAIEYDDINYDKAYAFMKAHNFKSEGGKCSSMRVGNWYARNFDWTYSNTVEFFVIVNRCNGRYASMGVSAIVPGLNKDFVESGKQSESYEMIPFYVLDGINEYGLFVNNNVVPKDDVNKTGRISKTIPTENEIAEVCMDMLPRYILDHYKTPEEAIEGLTKNVSICGGNKGPLEHYDCHFMIGDINNTYILEVIDNELIATKVGEGCKLPAAMTNFYNYNTELYEGKIVAYPENYSNVTDHGAGIERYNLIIDTINSITNNSDSGVFDTIKELMCNKINYTQFYKTEVGDDFWWSEMVGEYGIANITNSTPHDDSFLLKAIDFTVEQYNNREDGGRDREDTWQTIHTSIYDLANKKLHLFIQEQDKEYSFEFKNKVTIK